MKKGSKKLATQVQQYVTYGLGLHKSMRGKSSGILTEGRAAEEMQKLYRVLQKIAKSDAPEEEKRRYAGQLKTVAEHINEATNYAMDDFGKKDAHGIMAASQYGTHREKVYNQFVEEAETLKGRGIRRNLISHLSSVIAIVGVLGGIFFLSSKITGNAIADLTTKTTSFIGTGLLIVGLVAGFFWIKSRKK